MVSNLILVSFCETKVVSPVSKPFWWYFFFVESFKGSKIAVFWPKFAICWVSRVPKFPRIWNAIISIMDLEDISDSRVSRVSSVSSVSQVPSVRNSSIYLSWVSRI